MNDMFVRRRGQVGGPFPVEEIKAMIARGDLVPLHELSFDGVEWIRAGKIWEEFVPKPKSMIEMAERRPVIVKPAVQPVDMHKASGSRSKSERQVAPETRMPQPPEQFPPARARATTDDEDAPQPASNASPDDLIDDDVFERDRQVRPEPAVGAKALNGLVIVAAASVVACMVLSIVGIVFDLRTLDRFVPQTPDRLKQIYASGMFAISDFVRVLLLVFNIFSLLLFLTWVYFSARFLYAKSHGRMAYSPAWCVGWFFVPILNLWKPYKVMREIERRSEQYLRFDDPRVIRDPVVGVWWTCRLLEAAAIWFLLTNRSVFSQVVELENAETEAQIERLKMVPKLVFDFHTNEIACLCIAFVSGIATLVLFYRFERVRPKWETRSRRRRVE